MKLQCIDSLKTETLLAKMGGGGQTEWHHIGYLPFVGGGIEAFHVKYGGDSIEAADSKHHLVYHLVKKGWGRM